MSEIDEDGCVATRIQILGSFEGELPLRILELKRILYRRSPGANATFRVFEKVLPELRFLSAGMASRGPKRRFGPKSRFGGGQARFLEFQLHLPLQLPNPPPTPPTAPLQLPFQHPDLRPAPIPVPISAPPPNP